MVLPITRAGITCLMIVIVSLQSSLAQSPKDQITYICAPCGCPSDSTMFYSPGNCPSCQMPLIPQYAELVRATVSNTRRTAAILLFERADIMDVTGPWSVFEHSGFRVITVAKSTELIQLGRSMHLKPDFKLDACPDFDVLVIPGGGPAESRQDSALVVWIQDRYDSTETLLSVCSGAFYLGAAGLLDGHEATTFAALINDLREQFPNAIVRSDVKYTERGKIFTSAGLSSGIDASLKVVAQVYGMGRARDIANHMEYDWDADHAFVRSQMADNYLSSIRGLVSLFATEYLSSNGNKDQWEYRYLLTEQLSTQKIQELIEQELNKISSWTKTGAAAGSFEGVLAHPTLGLATIRLSMFESPDGPVALLTAERMGRDS